MEDLKSNPNLEKELQSEGDLTLEYLFSFSDMSELPKLFYSRLSEFCDRTLLDLKEARDILERDSTEDTYADDITLTSHRARIHARLSAGSLYTHEGEELERLPLFENYSSIAVDDFIFI